MAGSWSLLEEEEGEGGWWSYQTPPDIHYAPDRQTRGFGFAQPAYSLGSDYAKFMILHLDEME